MFIHQNTYFVASNNAFIRFIIIYYEELLVYSQNIDTQLYTEVLESKYLFLKQKQNVFTLYICLDIQSRLKLRMKAIKRNIVISR